MSLSTLPVDILRLLPQWLSIEDVLVLLRVCKLWYKLFALPPRVNIVLEYLGTDPVDNVTVATLLLGDMPTASFPSISILDASLSGYDWTKDYKIWVIEVPLREAVLAVKGRRVENIFLFIQDLELPPGEEGKLLSTGFPVNTVTYHLVSYKEWDGYYPGMEVLYEMGPFTPKWRLPLLPNKIEYDQAFLSYQVGDVSYELIPGYDHCLVLDSAGVWVAYLQCTSPNWKHCAEYNFEAEYEHRFYIMLKGDNDDSSLLSDDLEVYHRLAAYVADRLKGLGLLER